MLRKILGIVYAATILLGLGSARPAVAQRVPNEIVELARALKNDPDLIYEYVYNNIRTLPMQGSIKGALGTMLDGEGTGIDQAELMVTLLRQANYTANYAVGSIHLSGNQLANWFGSDTGYYSLLNLLFLGGFQHYGCDTVDHTPNTPVTDCHFDWVWVQVTIGGSDYMFDPATKYFDPTGGSFNPAIYGYNRIAGLGTSALLSAMGYNRSSFLTDAAAVTTTSPWALTSLNRTALRNDLAGYTSNLVQYLRTNSPAAAPSDIIGGASIIPLPLGTQQRYSASGYLPYQFVSTHTTSATIPSGYRVLLTQTLGYMSGTTFVALSSAITFNTADIYGHRTTLSFSGAGVGSLLVDGVAQITASGAVPGGAHLTVRTTIDYNWHAAPVYFPGISNDTKTNVPSTANGLFALVLSLGSTSRGMIENHRRKLAQNIALNPGNPTAEAVLGESLMIIAYTYTAECAQFFGLVAPLGGVVLQNFNFYGTYGVATFSGVSGPQISIWAQAYSYTQATGNPPRPTSPAANVTLTESTAFVASGLANGIAESATIQQTQPGNIGFSVPRALDIAVQQNIKIFDINNATQSANNASYYTSTVRPLMAPSWGSTDLSWVDTYVSNGERIITPQSGSLTLQSYLGSGFTRVAQQFGFDSLGGSISGELHGGSATDPTSVNDVADNTYFTVVPDSTDPAYVAGIGNCPGNCVGQLSPEPINLVSGDYTLNTTDLTTGSTGTPYGLMFQRYYNSGARLQNGPMGLGWTHNFGITARADSDPFEALASNSPINGASAIVATLVALDIASIDGVIVGRSLANIVIADLVYVWASDQMASNIVAVTQPGYVEHFVKLPDGSYNPPPGSGASLAFDGTSYTYVAKDGTTLAFNPAGNLATWTSPAGPAMTLAYDTSTPPKLTSVTNNSGRSLAFTYTSGVLTQVTDDSGRSVSYGYDGSSNLTSFVDTLGQTTTYAYDSPGRMTQIFYPWTGATPFVTNVYDSLSRVKTQTNVLGATWNYYLAGTRSEEVDPYAMRHVLYITPHGRTAIEIQDWQGTSQTLTTSAYDGLDRLTLATAPEGNTAGYTYDLKSNVLTATRTPKPGSGLSPLVTTTTYDPTFNKPLTVTDPRGLVATMSYDAGTGSLLSMVADSGSGHFNATTRYAYNGLGLPLTVTDPLGVVTRYTYDGFGNRTSKIGAAGAINQTTSYAYNAVGDVTSVTDANGHVATNTYDAARRVTTSTAPPPATGLPGIVTAYTYDPAGRVTQTQQSAGGSILHTTAATYTLSGKTATATDANAHVTIYAYDLLDRQTSTTDAIGRVTQYVYDPLSRRTKVFNPAISTTVPLAAQAFTANGLRASLTDANVNTTTFAYDGLDRLNLTTYPNASTETATYDADSNVLTRKTRAGATIPYTYDTLNRLSTKSPPSSPVVTYTYDLAGRRTGVSDTSSAITAIPTPGSTVTYATSYTYDALNRLLNTSWSPVPTAAAAAVTSSVSFTHGYNAVNQRTSQAVSDNVWIGYPTATASTTAYTANTLNQYTAVGAVSPTYDGNGNLLTDGTTSFGYDTENRMASAAATGMTASYAHDGRGRRKSKTVNGTTTITITDADNRAVLDYDGASGAILRWYAYGLGPNAVLSQMNVGAGTRTMLVPDMLGSIIGSMDSGATAITPFAYRPYGSASATPAAFGYTGQRVDTESGTYYYRARQYSTDWGRFWQANPIGYGDGPHLYAYVWNDPLNLIDPTGQDSFWVARPLNSSLGSLGVNHAFIVANAQYPGDPAGQVISFGQLANGNMGNVNDTTRAAPISASTHISDTAAWNSLGAPGSAAAYARINAPDSTVASVANRVSEDNSYYPVPGLTWNSVNSNSAASAVADRSIEISGGASMPFSTLLLPGVAQSGRVGFRPK